MARSSVAVTVFDIVNALDCRAIRAERMTSLASVAEDLLATSAATTPPVLGAIERGLVTETGGELELTQAGHRFASGISVA